jgi:hypothetical protein
MYCTSTLRLVRTGYTAADSVEFFWRMNRSTRAAVPDNAPTLTSRIGGAIKYRLSCIVEHARLP